VIRWQDEDWTRATRLKYGHLGLRTTSVPGTEGGEELTIEQGKELERDDGNTAAHHDSL